MRLFSRFRFVSAIGLEIVSGEIRVVQLRKKLSKISVEKEGIGYFPAEAIQDGKIKEPEKIIRSLRQLVEKWDLKKIPTIITLPHHCVMSKQLTFPIYLKEDECEAEIAEQLNQYLPGMDEALGFDFVVVDKSGDEQQKILLFAVRQSQLDAYVAVANESGFHVSAVDVDTYALTRAIQWELGLTQDPLRFLGLLCFHPIPQFILLKNHEIIFTQTVLIDFEASDVVATLMRQIKSLIQMRSLSMADLDVLILVGNSPLDEIRFKKESEINVMWVKKFQKINLDVMQLSVSVGLALKGICND